MPRFEIKVPHRPDIKVPGFTTDQMHEIGQRAVEVMKERVAQGVDVLDQPAKPLQPKYAERKRKAGKQPIRDIRFTGNTLGSLQVDEANDTHVHVKIQGATPFRKALFNQNLDPWFGLSDHDDDLVLETAQAIFALNIQEALK